MPRSDVDAAVADGCGRNREAFLKGSRHRPGCAPRTAVEATNGAWPEQAPAASATTGISLAWVRIAAASQSRRYMASLSAYGRKH